MKLNFGELKLSCMKKIRVILTVVAIAIAVGGICAHGMTQATTYWVPSYAHRSAIFGAYCEFQVNKPCDEGSAVRCTLSYSYLELGVFTVIVSKEDVSTGLCSVYFKNQ
jgi:hypothetical protein